MPKNSVKTVVTIGPASDSVQMIKILLEKGADVFRLNASHNDLDYHKRIIERIRSLEKLMKLDIPILLDLPGPKLRTGKVKEGKVNLKIGEVYTFGPNADIEISSSIINKIRIGDTIKLSDGKFELKVISRTDSTFRAKSLDYGQLLEDQSINCEHLTYEKEYPTERDREIIRFGLENGVNCFGLSFVSSAKDVMNVRKLTGEDSILVSKIERPDAVKNLKEILSCTDVVMVARGDLGLNVDISKLPEMQRSMIALANQAHKPVIIATQMLESMVANPIPTRAEVNDVFTAIYEGTDAVMLSEESAVGNYPIKSFVMLKKLIDSFDNKIIQKPTYKIENEEDGIADAAVLLSERINVNNILVLTSLGGSAFRLSRYHSDKRIFAATDKKSTFYRLSFGRNIYPLLFPSLDGFKGEAMHKIKNLTDADKIIVLSDSFVEGHKAKAISLLYL